MARILLFVSHKSLPASKLAHPTRVNNVHPESRYMKCSSMFVYTGDETFPAAPSDTLTDVSVPQAESKIWESAAAVG